MKFRSAASLACVVLLMAASPAAERAAAKRAFAPIFSALEKSAVPVLLPGALPGPDLINATGQLDSAGKNGYSIELALAPDCGGADACHIGQISGKPSDGSDLSGDEVDLPIGVTGYYVQGACGASCSDSTITFDRNDARYVFAEKGASKADLMQLTATIVSLGRMENS